MGSSMLFGAISDLDLGEAQIPQYAPADMPDNEYVGTEPATEWSHGYSEGS